MKQVHDASPNLRLKAERELRGWSQKHVANQIGADHYYLSRWERGTTSPSPYYRQKLCDLFGKNAEELGLIQEKAGQHDTSFGKQDTPIGGPPGRVYDPATPLLIAGANVLVGREEMC